MWAGRIIKLNETTRPLLRDFLSVCSPIKNASKFTHTSISILFFLFQNEIVLITMVSTRRSFVDEREDIQKKAFTKWINNQLSEVININLLIFLIFSDGFLQF